MDDNRSNTQGAISGQPLPQGVPSHLIALGGGYAFPEMLPDVSLEAANAARDFRTEVLQYGPLFGLTELRDEIVRYVGQDGVQVGRDNICVVNGAKQGLDLALRTLVEKGDSVIVSRPSYATALHILGNHGALTVEVDMDEDGMRADELEKTLQQMRSEGRPLPKLLYDVPDFHNPTGITLSEDRRRKLVDLAEEFNFYIVEDDPYRRLRFEGAPVPPIRSFDSHGRVIGAGTFSKIFGPGIRVGWVNADADLVYRMATRKTDGGVCPLTQRIILECLKTGKIDQHVRELLPAYTSHRDAMVRAVQEYMPDIRFRSPQGGYYMWLELPAQTDCDEVTVMAEREGVAVFSGRGYFASDPQSNFIRLCFATCTEAQIDEGVRKLGDVIRRTHNLPAGKTSRRASHQAKHFD
jgi:2-aminoadipate transaminase